MIYAVVAISGFVLSIILVPLIRRLALKWQVVDQPSEERKVHKMPTPLMGGLAIFISTWIVMFVVRYFDLANFSKIPDKFLWGVLIGGIFLMIGGLLDDKYNLKPSKQLIWPILASLAILFVGIRIGFITNPTGGPDNAIVYLGPMIGIILTFIWIVGMMYTTKFLDGLDGLVSGITIIASIVIFLLSLDWDVPMSATGVWALALAGAAAGFLIFNWHPAKIFLGEGGSLWIGFMLGVLSIISGSKITTTLLVIGIPVLDVMWVIIRRLASHQSPFKGDSKHLHFQLLNLGLSQRKVVMLLYLISLIFGAIAVFGSSFGKMIGLGALVIFMVILLIIIYLKFKIHGRAGANNSN